LQERKTLKLLKIAKTLTGAIALSFSLSAAGYAQTTLKFATVAPQKSVWGVQIQKLAKAVEEKSNGTLKLEVFFGGALGPDKDNIRQIQRGRLDSGSFTAAILPTIAPETAVLAMPYVWDNFDQLSCALDNELSDDIRSILADKGMHLLGWTLVGEMGFSSIAPVKSIADLKGQSIRSIPSKASTDFWSAAGLVPQTIAPSDISSALSTKRITAAEGSMVFYVVTGENKIAPHWTQAKHVYIPGVFVVSKKKWDGLSNDQKAAFEAAYREVALPWFSKALAGFMEKVKQMQAGAGGTYSELSTEDTAALRALAEKTRPDALKALGGNTQKLWAHVQNAKASCNK